ncbi:GYF domain-containing protein [Mycena chlorophos]|uniref:GYF domain-containing protein n=1 Tax=Mycena chlorophos TaxID=658473 RepID=A0A8H6T3U9_MYCCL|nr:GYF domain-containing protein [Mycena chlorophos]
MSRRISAAKNSLDEDDEMHSNGHAVSSSLNGISVSPRVSKHLHRNSLDDDAVDEVELSLLGEDERRQAAAGLDVEEQRDQQPHSLSSEDKRAMVLLCVLYLIQGVPLGLALGSVPFILREQLSYSQLGTFALSGYPYSLKLLWSPIVDSLFFSSIGRRKSWIIPMQIIIGTLMLYLSLNVQVLMDDASHHVSQLTFLFTSLVFFSATQDIAVDGWALTLLSPESLSYASTCQTIGLNTGFFASFTVFLAFNSEAFATKWGVPHLTLSAYLQFWCVMSYAVSLWLLFVKRERKEPLSDVDLSITAVYKQIWAICKLKHVQLLIVVHLFAKIGWAVNEAATSLKMVEKGFLREDLAIAVLIDFPFQIAGGWLAAKWSQGDHPLRPWLIAFWPRLGFALMATLIVYWFPTPPITMGFFIFLIIHTVLSSFASTVQFVGISAFHTRISDPLIGGTYMTLLNTFTNMGGTWPKWFVLKGVDLFTEATCKVKDGSTLIATVSECVSEEGKEACKAAGGECHIESDGYYILSGICMFVGALLVIFFIAPTVRRLQGMASDICVAGKDPIWDEIKYNACRRVHTLQLTANRHKALAMTTHTQSSTMQFGPEWMRVKPAAKGVGPSPPPGSASTYSALVSPSPATSAPKRDESQPFRYTREEMLKIYRDGGGKGGLGLEVERHEGIVRDTGSDPVALKEMSDSEKKVFANGVNSELRRRPSIDTERPRIAHSSSGTGSPLRERFNMRRQSSDQLAPRRLSLSNTQTPVSPALPSPRTRFGQPPTFDGVLNGGESWVARRRLSEAKATNASRDPESHDGRTTDIREEDEDPPKPAAPVKQPTPPNPPPPQDLAAVQWSYLDPQGQLQGPFRADLMQKWYDEGYFTPELLMKRTHIDVDWVSVKDLAHIARMAGIDKLFYAPSLPAGPPGISRGNDPPAEQNAFVAPLQPAPVRTLRSSTLDAFSTNSDSPSSSFGTGRFGKFGNGSPDSSGFGGRASSQYSADSPNVGNRFGVGAESSSALRRTGFGDPMLDPPATNTRYTGNEIYGTNGMSQGPWPIAPAFDGGYGSNVALGQAAGYGQLRTAQDPGFGHDASAGVPEYLANNAAFGPGQQYNALHGSPFLPSQPPAASLFTQGSKPLGPAITPQNVPTQSPWGAPLVDPMPVRRQSSDPARPPSPVQSSPWGAPAPAPAPAPVAAPKAPEPSPWFAASQGVIDDNNWKEDRGHSLTFSNLGQHNQQLAEGASKVAPPVEVAQPPPPVDVPAKPTQATKARAKSIPQPVVQPPVPTPVVEAEQVVSAGAPKTAWAKEDESKRPKASGVALSLREIQDAEAKKAGARKLAEQRPAPARPSTSAVQPSDDAPSFTGSWGLPTSQAGRPTPAKETPPVLVATPNAANAQGAGGPAPVWTNATKTTAKKSMKEIQEEEERRKKMAASKEPVAAPVRRAYAESTTKASAAAAAAASTGGAWTTVGAPKTANPPATTPTRPAATAPAVAANPSTPRANGTAAPPRTAPTPVKVEEQPVAPSNEFMRWVVDTLKGLNTSVHVDEILSMLLSFPLDPDASTVELISDLIYANSTTLDGRRFASEFVSKRKADALSRPKGASKGISIADVVKAQPKPPASSEWGGFKVVNKKKKGGRS